MCEADGRPRGCSYRRPAELDEEAIALGAGGVTRDEERARREQAPALSGHAAALARGQAPATEAPDLNPVPKSHICANPADAS